MKKQGYLYGNAHPIMHMFQDQDRLGFVCSVDFVDRISIGAVLLRQTDPQFNTAFVIKGVLDSYSVGSKYSKCCGFSDAVYMMCSYSSEVVNISECEYIDYEEVTAV
ncbi:MAG: hypothetical protein ACRBF0_19945 [Calditrichia bacterium]